MLFRSLDTTDDYFAIEFGIYLYDNYYADGVLTVEEFNEALQAFPNNDMLNSQPMPIYKPADQEYSVDDFYYGDEGVCAQ